MIDAQTAWNLMCAFGGFLSAWVIIHTLPRG